MSRHGNSYKYIERRNRKQAKNREIEFNKKHPEIHPKTDEECFVGLRDALLKKEYVDKWQRADMVRRMLHFYRRWKRILEWKYEFSHGFHDVPTFCATAFNWPHYGTIQYSHPVYVQKGLYK